MAPKRNKLEMGSEKPEAIVPQVDFVESKRDSKFGDESSSRMKVIFMVSKKTGEVVYLEAGKDFVDVLISYLVMPLGRFMNVLQLDSCSQQSISGLLNILTSVVALEESLLILDKAVFCDTENNAGGSPVAARCGEKHYVCNCNCSTVSNIFGAKCPDCIRPMLTEATFVSRPGARCLRHDNHSQADGFVKENVSFLISDDLQITPTSSINLISLMRNSNLDDIEDAEPHIRYLGKLQVLQLLRYALSSSTKCLNDIYQTLGVNVGVNLRSRGNFPYATWLTSGNMCSNYF